MSAATASRTRTEDAALRTLLRGWWPSLPALLIGSVVFCAAGSTVVFAAPGANAVSIALCALLVAPAFAALVGTVDVISDDDEPSLHDWWRALRSQGLLGLKLAVLPAVFAELFLASVLVWDGGRRPIALPSLALTGAAALMSLLLWAVATAAAPRSTVVQGRRLWLVAASLVVARPVRFVAPCCLAALGVWTAVTWSASLLLIVPAPVAFVLVSAVRTTAIELDLRTHPPS